MTQVENIPTAQIIPGDNDRTVFDQRQIESLAASIAANGLAQPVTVRILDTDTPDPLYQIVAGERRYRACKLLGMESIPAIVADLTDEEAAAVMLAENTARADLDPIDQALAYQKRMQRFGWSAQTVAEKAGVTSVHVLFRLKLLKLRPNLQDLVRTGSLPLGYAQILADADLDPNRQMLAFSKLRDNPNPTTGWFRRLCGQLLEEQAQRNLFDMGAFVTCTPAPAAPADEPPHPGTTRAPALGATLQEVIRYQVLFWQRAAASWEKLGKTFKKQECEAAALALSHLVE